MGQERFGRTWVKGFKVILWTVLYFGFAMLCGALPTMILYALLIVLPLEAIFHVNDAEAYFPGVIFLGCAALCPFFVGQGLGLIRRTLEEIMQ